MDSGELKKILQGKIVFVGIGNPLKGDDGFGPELIARLQGRVRALCLDAGTAPESYTGKVVREDPDTIVFVDAVHMGLPPGETRVLAGSEILKAGFTTHDLSPSLLIQYLESQTPRSRIYLLGVEPQALTLGEPISAAIKETLEDLSRLIREILHA